MADRNEPTEVGIVNMKVKGVRIDEKNQPKDGWTYCYVPAEAGQPQSERLAIADNREKVYEMALAIFDISAKIGKARRAKSTVDGKTEDEWKEDLKGAMIAFHQSFHTPAAMFVQEFAGLGGRNRYQRIILNNPEGHEADGDFNVCHVFGDCRTWWPNPFLKVYANQRESQQAIVPVVAFDGRPVVIVEMIGRIIRRVTYAYGEDGFEVETFLRKEETTTQAPANGAEVAARTAQLPPTDAATAVDPDEEILITCPECHQDFTVGMIDFQEGETVDCPLCPSDHPTRVGPLVNKHTLLAADAIGILLKLTDEQIIKLGEAGIETVGQLAGYGDSELKKFLGLKTITQARTIIKKATENMVSRYMPAAIVSSEDEEDEE